MPGHRPLALATVANFAYLVCTPLPAQERAKAPAWDRQQIIAHLQSVDVADVAWAGWLVRHRSVRGITAELRAALARLAGADDFDGQMARLQLLDALLQSGIRMPGEELLPHAVGYLRVPMLVLASRSPLQNTGFFAARFDALQDQHDLEWQACGNLLAAQRAPGFAARCLREFRPLLRVEVVDGLPAKPVGVG